jgi:hypothetical protein
VWGALESLYCPFVIVSSSRFDLCDHLSEERVERDPTLCELFNEGVGFFVSLNLMIKYCVSCPFTFTSFIVTLSLVC